MRESTGTTPGFQAEFTKSTGQNRYDRYPGPRSFADNDVDQHLFFGREQEIDHLVHRVRAIRVLVLFGRSGLGKTSLLQAGLYPHLRERGLLPVPVRLNQPQIAPVDAVLEALRVTCETHGVDYEPRKTEGLWEFFKTTDLWRGDVLQTPVLVFDQFEELFTLQSDEARAALASELGELAARGLPTRIRQRLQTGEQVRYSDTQPEVKVILSLREEYVGALEDLVPNVPAIFEQRFRLAPLNQELACRAVVEPAELDKSEVFATRPFRYTDTALDAMMEFLVNRQGEVEPFQLQILCRYTEQQVALRQREGARDVKVDDTLLGGRKAMETLLQNFYRNAVREIPSWRQRSRARCLCELGLLSQDGHRVSMEQGQIRAQYKVIESSLETLTQARLIRKEARPGLEGFYCELSHDSVARAVNSSRRFRVPTVIKVAFGGFLLLAALAGFWSYQRVEVAEQRAQTEKLTVQVARNLNVKFAQELVVRGGLVEPEMVNIRAGTFQMGDIQGGGDKDELPVHDVRILRGFAVSQHEITFDQYDQFAAATGRKLPDDEGWGRGRRPVINVSWHDAVEYAKWLSAETGKRYRLPTEAEWEYAARAGTETAYWWGSEPQPNMANCRDCGSQWDRKPQTAPVGSFKANPFGLYDTAGNVWEWVQDCGHENYKGAPSDGSPWENGGNCPRVLRGGSWNFGPWHARSSYRGRYTPDHRSNGIGFRLAQDITKATEETARYLSLARVFRERGAYNEALSQLTAANVLDPTNNEVRVEIERTMRVCNAEKRLGRRDLKC